MERGLSTPDMSEAQMEQQVTAALERKPAVVVPAEFAARVVASLPAVRPARRRVHAGRTAAVVAMVIALAAMVWLAPQSAPTVMNLPFDAELLLMVELAGIAAWLVLKWREV